MSGLTKMNKQKCPSRKLRDTKRLLVFLLEKKDGEIINLKTENLDKINKALQKQKEPYISRHNSILQKLENRHRIKLNETIDSYKREFSVKHRIVQNKLFHCEKENLFLKEKIQIKISSSIYGTEQVEPVDLRKFEPIDLSTIPRAKITKPVEDNEINTIRGYIKIPIRQPKKSVSWNIPGD